MVVQIICMLTMYPVLFILYFSMKGAGKAQSGYCFSCRMKADWMKDDDVQAVIGEYLQKLKRITQILAVIPLVTFFVPWFSVSFSIWMMWLLAVIVAPFVPYAQADHGLKALKMEKGWSQEAGESLRSELKNAEPVRRVRAASFLPPVIVSAVAAAAGLIRLWKTDYFQLGIISLIFAVITPLYYVAAVWMDRQKTEMISSDSAVNVDYARAKKSIWKKFWLLAAWENAACTAFVAAAFVWDGVGNGTGTEWVLWGSIAYCIVICVTMFFALKKVFALEDIYKEKRDIAPEDDDARWIFGMFYYNKDDKHAMVTRRVGLGTTMNMATAAGKVMTAIGIAGLLVIPISCVWIMLEEFTPLKLTVQEPEQMLVAEHLGVDYEIPLSEIEDITLTYEMPRRTKLNGSGMENLCKGTFRVGEEGKCQLFLNPQNEAFLRIEAGGVIYYMSDADNEDTMEIYARIADGLVGE